MLCSAEGQITRVNCQTAASELLRETFYQICRPSATKLSKVPKLAQFVECHQGHHGCRSRHVAR